MMRDIHSRLLDEFHDSEARRDYSEDFGDAMIALQIKALRQQQERGWTQQELASRAGMKQSQISAMEQADYSSWTTRSLRQLAAAFDLHLLVRFESFGALLKEACEFSRTTLERPSFADDPVFHPTTAEDSTVVDFASRRTLYVSTSTSAADTKAAASG